MRRNLTEQELESLQNAESLIEWDKISDQIYADCGFQYPRDWSDKVLFGKLIPKYLQRK